MDTTSEAFSETGKHLLAKKLFSSQKSSSTTGDIQWESQTQDPIQWDSEQALTPQGKSSQGISGLVRGIASSGAKTALSPFISPVDPTDPFQVKQRILETPNAGALFPIAGQATGTILGSEVGHPFLGRTAGGAVGGAIGRAADLFQEAKRSGAMQLPSDTVSQVGKEAAFTGAISMLPSPQEAVSGAKRVFGTMQMGKQLGLPAKVEQSASRLAFLKGIQQEAAQAPKESGASVGDRIAQLTAEHPERQAMLASHLSTAVDKIRGLISQNPILHREVLRSAEKLGTRDLATGLLPELQLAPTSEGQVVTQAESGFRKKVFEELFQQGTLGAVSPETATLDQVQKLKQTFGGILGKKLGSFGGQLTQTEFDAMEAYGTLRQAELATHPELAGEFARHKELMDHFREAKGVLSNLSSLETGMRGGFEGTAAKQEAFKKLLSPESFLKTQMFADAANFAKAKGMLIRRAALYGAMIPLYTLFTLIRGELFRSVR